MLNHHGHDKFYGLATDTFDSTTISTNFTNFAPMMTLGMAKKRANLLTKMRQFFAQRNVLEVQTPLLSQAGNTDVYLQSIPADATYLDRLTRFYLHTSPEFAMKRLLASWQVPIYQICPVFRDNERGNRHNLEFTMLEWYRPNFDLSQLAQELTQLLELVSGQQQILSHYRYVDAFMDHVGVHPLTSSTTVLKAVAEDKGITHHLPESGVDEHQMWLDLLFSHLVEPNLGRELPTLIVDYPKATAALARIEKDKDGHEVAKRFELYINGIEIANAYDELADAKALQQRFELDNQMRQAQGLPVMPIDNALLQAVEQMPACSGIALGVDRLLMVLTNSNHIDEVIAFGSDRA